MAANNYVQEKLNKVISTYKLGSKMRNFLVRQAAILNSLNITDENGLKKYHYLCQYVPRITNKIVNNSKYIDPIIIKSLMKNDIGKSEDVIKDNIINAISKMSLIKLAYPHDMSEIEPIKKYDLSKWYSALNDIYVRTRVYGNKKEAIDFVTKEWGNMDEKLDFERWLKYFDDNGYNLYKSANVKMFDSGIAVPIQNIPGLINNRDDLNEEVIPEETTEKKRDIRSQIISRIESAKRLLSRQEGRDFARGDYDKLLSSILTLEGDLLKIRADSMVDDIICRAYNGLIEEGCDDSTLNLFIKIAQLPPLPDLGGPGGPLPGGPNEPAEGGAGPKGDEKEGEKAIQEFELGMKGYSGIDSTPAGIRQKFKEIRKDFEKKTWNPLNEESSNKKVHEKKAYMWANINTPEIKYLENLVDGIIRLTSDTKKYLYAIAQEMPVADEPIPEDVPTDIPEGAPAETDIPTEEPVEEKSKTDKAIDEIKNEVKDPIEQAFGSIKLSDVITRLESLSRVFKNREIARQLSIIDLMLDSLGISGFFPALAEATRSALESNQYCQTRVEEVLSKLVSATDETGQSILETEKLKGGKVNTDSFVDKEMKQYLDEPKKVVNKEPAQKPMEAAPIPAAEPGIAPAPAPIPAKPAAPKPIEQPMV